MRVIAQAAHTTNQTSSDYFTRGVYKGVRVDVDIQSITSGETLTVTIQGKVEESGDYFTLLASAALSAAGVTRLAVYPGLTGAANAKLDDALPPTWRVTTTQSGGTCTYSVQATPLA